MNNPKYSLDQIFPQINTAHAQKKTIILATGVFDLLHSEHKKFLEKSKNHADLLIVGIESDHRVKLIKGNNRPINNQQIRYNNLAKLPFVDLVFILPKNFSKPQHHRQLIAKIKPNILAVSSHSPHLDKKQKILSEFGGTVKITHQHNPNISTTQIINQHKLND